MYKTVFWYFAYFSHCLAMSQDCLRFDCYQVSSRALAAFFRNYCSRFYFSCSIVINGLCFSCQIYNCRCLLQQLYTGSSFFFSFLLKSLFLYFFSQGKGLAQSSSDLFREYITVTFSPLILKSEFDDRFKARAASSGVKNSIKAKSLSCPVILLRIIRISLTEQMSSNTSSRFSSSISVMTGPLTIKLQLLIFSSRFMGLELAPTVLKLSLQLAFFQPSHRQHLFLLAKFLQSHFSQYQSQAMLRSIRLQGWKFMRQAYPPMVIVYLSRSFILVDTQIDGYLAQIDPSFNYTSSGTLVPAVMLASVSTLQAASLFTHFSIFKVLVSSTLKRGYNSGYYLAWYFSLSWLLNSRLSTFREDSELDEDEDDEDED